VALSLPWVVLVAVEIEKFLFRRGLIYQGSGRRQHQVAALSPRP